MDGHARSRMYMYIYEFCEMSMAVLLDSDAPVDYTRCSPRERVKISLHQ